MSFGDWVRVSAAKIRGKGREGVADVAYDLYTGLWWLAWPIPRGTNVYERDWDLLVVLDACRVDLLRSVADEYAFLDGEIERTESVGSMTKEWLAKTFTDEYAAEVANTAYVTGNVFSDRILESDRFRALEEVWRDGWDEERDTVPPRSVTDRAIRTARETDPDRLIVHYVQPHHPFLDLEGFDAAPFGPALSDTVVDALRKGKISRNTFWNAYQDNLRRALDDVELLLENVDAERVAITADHGDALGEWGIYDHPVGCLHPAVRTVPWTTTTATDRGTYEPDLERERGERDESGESSVEDRLQALGYRG